MFNWRRKQATKEELLWQEKERLWQEKQQLWDQFREWYQSCEQARHFTFMKCLWCHTPAPSDEANFCPSCGASFHPQPGQHHDTEPLQASVGEPRPYESYRQMQQMISEQDTQQVSTARPVGIKRTVRIPRLERLA